MLRRVWRVSPTRQPHPSCSPRLASSVPVIPHVEVSPGEYAERRRHFLECLPSHSITLLPAADEAVYSHDILWPHRQDSLWHHLFGLRLPMRRELAPPASSTSDDVRVTMAVFAKCTGAGGSGSSSSRGAAVGTHTLLCVPPTTTDRETLVWGSNTVNLADYERLLAGDGNSATAAAAASPAPGRHTHAVVTNDVETVRREVCRLIAHMAETQLTTWAESGGVDDAAASSPPPPPPPPNGAGAVREGRRRLLSIMPSVFAAYPRQLRWDGRRYRLRHRLVSTVTAGATAEDTAPRDFLHHHPLEALFSALFATPFSVQQPSAASTTVEVRYSVTAGHTPGLAPSRDTANATPPSTGGGPPSVAPVRLPIRCSDAYAWLYREVKAPSQVRQHLRSARATEDAFLRVMRRAAATLSEHAIHCEFQRAVCDASARAGAAAQVRSAYIPVVASGERGTAIHFTDNDGVAEPGEVVRVDAGVEVDGVPTDCTRTFPIGGPRFTPSQTLLYERLLQLQRSLLRRIGAGVAVGDVARLHMDETQALLCAMDVDVRGTAARSAPSSPPDPVASREEQVPLHLVRSCFCAHSFGHFFGIDIHEDLSRVGPVAGGAGVQGGSAEPSPRQRRSAPRIFRGGMMHTVEPGVYLPSLQRAALFGLDATHLPRPFHGGIGMQVEDDVLILPPPDYPDAAAGASGGREWDGRAAVAEACLWSRGTYLQHALAAFHRHYSDTISDTAATPSVLVEECDAHLSRVGHGSMSAAATNVARFLFAQRVAVDGLAAAESALAGDARTAEQLSYVDNPAYATGLSVPDASASGWYPYPIIVLTATIPKDVSLIEAVMQR
ncbi:aminopeptidase P1 [Novymonas esmeraldas]|uniref:Aminopeptidase P1 n=1 Tax=Novymonas esmeraldas TaxID=1808958 RepID=A0AAW0EIT0_9TRYP